MATTISLATTFTFFCKLTFLMCNDIIRFNNIKKSYSNIEALRGVSFSVPKKSIFGILGANGSGKTTLMKILPGLIRDWSGDIYYNDNRVHKDSLLLRKEIGYLIESPAFYEYLSAYKNLQILARISGVDFSRIEYVLKIVGLIDRAEDIVSSYSYGMKQRLGIAQVLMHDPKVIVLDEPNNGLDPNGVSDMINLIKKMNLEGKTICFSTHNLKDVEDICTHFTVFNSGISSDSISISDLIFDSNKWSVVTDNPDLAVNKINCDASFSIIGRFNNKIILESSNDADLEEISRLLKGLVIYSIKKESNLIEYFYND